jgi:hypothetical protein
MSVLSAMLLSPTAIAAVSEHLTSSDFYRRTHGIIFDIARGLFERGEPVDAITVAAKLEEESQLELVGGRPKIHEIAAWASATGNAAHYALIVRDHALIRRLSDAGREITRLDRLVRVRCGPGLGVSGCAGHHPQYERCDCERSHAIPPRGCARIRPPPACPACCRMT